jgi:Mg-chelatase subunit ChlD
MRISNIYEQHQHGGNMVENVIETRRRNQFELVTVGGTDMAAALAQAQRLIHAYRPERVAPFILVLTDG